MITFKELKEMSAEKVKMLNELKELEKQAEEIEWKIMKTYTFHMFENKIQVFCNSAEPKMLVELTHDGIATFNVIATTYKIKCDSESIFQCMMADYLKSNGYLNKPKEELSSEEKAYIDEMNDKATQYTYLSNFISETKIRYVNAKTEENKIVLN